MMTAPKRPNESEPFIEPLTPLPSAAPMDAEGETSAPDAVAEEVREMEPERVLPAEDEIEELSVMAGREMEMAVVDPTQAPRWKFWKRPNKRDQQLETLRQGACEMVDLMRSIRDHLRTEEGDREGLRQTLSPLPLAVESLRTMSEHQADAGRALGELRTTIERRAEHEGVLVQSLNRIGDTMGSVDETFGMMDRTLAGMDRSNQRTIATIQKLGERVEDSDRFMNETFARLRDAEREFTDYVARSSRRSAFGMMALCSILLVSVLAVGFMFKENRELLTAVQRQVPLVVQAPARMDPARVTILEELEGADDGIAEPEREIAREDDPGDGSVEAVGTGERPLLSVNKLPSRK